MNAIPFIQDDIALPDAVLERLRNLRQDAADAAALADAGRGSDSPADLAERRARANAASQILMRCQQHLERHAGALQEAAPIKVALEPGQSTTAAVDACRQAIEAAKADIKSTRTAPPSADELKARAREMVAKAVKGFRPFIDTVDGLRVLWPRTGVVNPRTADDYTETAAGIDVMSLLGWLDSEHLTERLEAEIDARFPGDGLTDSERATRQADLEAKLLETERREEELVRMARQSGSHVARRAHADPRAILGVV